MAACLDTQTITVNVTDVDRSHPHQRDARQRQFRRAGRQRARSTAFGGIDTVHFGFKLTDATVTLFGQQGHHRQRRRATRCSPASRRFVFTDGTVDNNDGNALVDDLFYYAHYHDVWNAQVDADAHYDAHRLARGPRPERVLRHVVLSRPSAPTRGGRHQSAHPLRHVGWKEGRIPSLHFDTLPISRPTRT